MGFCAKPKKLHVGFPAKPNKLHVGLLQNLTNYMWGFYKT